MIRLCRSKHSVCFNCCKLNILLYSFTKRNNTRITFAILGRWEGSRGVVTEAYVEGALSPLWKGMMLCADWLAPLVDGTRQWM